MAYPNFRNKHNETALFCPGDFISLKNMRHNRRFPKKYIIIYYQEILDYFKRTYKPKKVRFNRLITIYTYKDIGVVKMTGIGSPNAVAVFEELIYLGGKEFINIGSAGGLQSLGIFLCEKAIRDEGTSHHYIKHSKYAYPDKHLTARLENTLQKKAISFERAIGWTIDAPYRETKAEINFYRKKGVKTVDMESSALFAVAKVRKVKIASAFVVSDVLGEDKWDPQFDAKHVRQKLNTLFDVALASLQKH